MFFYPNQTVPQVIAGGLPDGYSRFNHGNMMKL